eukprot:8044053-Karenia_brevis.AAC.1
MVAETSGAWGPQAMSTFRALAKKKATLAGSDAGLALGAMLQELCVLIRSAGARAVLRREALLAAELDAPLARAQLQLAVPASVLAECV